VKSGTGRNIKKPVSCAAYSMLAAVANNSYMQLQRAAAEQQFK
jgi:hypothetical protein